MAVLGSRTARPTNQLAAVRHFYEMLVQLPVVFEFEDHDGFDGVILGLSDERAQLELVRAPGGDVAPRPTLEDLLVLYYDTAAARDEVVARLDAAGHARLAVDDTSLNPYWSTAGAVVVVDPDGYRLVLATA